MFPIQHVLCTFDESFFVVFELFFLYGCSNLSIIHQHYESLPKSYQLICMVRNYNIYNFVILTVLSQTVVLEKKKHPFKDNILRVQARSS